MPEVSIIVPCYNQAQFLDDALQSILSQTYKNWECIIINDGSNDNTEEVAEKWISKDQRFIYLYKENGGLSSARNLGLNNVKGNFIQFLDADDILNSNKIKLSLQELRHSTNNVVISNFNMFENNIDHLQQPFCNLKIEDFNFKNVLFGWDYTFNIPIHCGFFKKKIFEDFRFREELKAKEDWIMWLHIFKNDYNVSFIDIPLAYYRTHLNNMTKSVQHMEENYFKAIIHLKSEISEHLFIEFMLFVFQKKQQEIVKLKTKIHNIHRTKSYIFLEKLKNRRIIQFILKIIK